MDIAAIGLLAMAGYQMSQKQNTAKEKIQAKIQAEKIAKEPEPKFLDGSKTHNNMHHYYKGSQQYSNGLNSNKLGIYTGSNMMEYAPKNCRPEPENIIKPTKNLTHIHGTPNYNFRSRYNVTDKMHNVLPFEQKRIGPGMNTDDVAKGGFHSYFRVLPKNIGDYKKNNFKQRIVPGRGLIEERGHQPEVEAPTDKRYFESHEYEPMKAVNSNTFAPTVRSNYECKPCNKIEYDCHFGGAKGALASTSQDDTGNTRTKDTTLYSIGGNITGTTAPSNVTSTYIVTDTGREDCNDSSRNVTSGAHGTYINNGDNLNPTLRSTTHNKHYVGPCANQNGPKSYFDTDARMTQRGSNNTSYEGIPNGPKMSENRQYNVNQTQRENTSHSITGGAKYFTSAPELSKEYELFSNKESTNVGYVPGPQNRNVLSDPNKIHHEFKGDNNMERVEIPMQNKKITTVSQLGSIESESKVQEENKRIEDNFLSVAHLVMKDNPYALKIN
jgi:hypothetical protein